MTNYTWIVIDSSKGGAFVCKRCGDQYAPAMPINIDDYLALSKSFVKRHKNCKEKSDGKNTKGD